MIRYLTAFVIVFVAAIGVYAQSDIVTQDDVDTVASRMFCPICENEPLDQCYNPTCIQWKSEIRDLLAEGYGEDEIISSFVDRYGQHVVGVPQDPILRILSFGAPLIATIIALIIGWMTFQNWRKHEPISENTNKLESSDNIDSYRSQIERDLN